MVRCCSGSSASCSAIYVVSKNRYHCPPRQRSFLLLKKSRLVHKSFDEFLSVKRCLEGTLFAQSCCRLEDTVMCDVHSLRDRKRVCSIFPEQFHEISFCFFMLFCCAIVPCCCYLHPYLT